MSETKAMAKREKTTALAPQQARHFTLKDLLQGPVAQQKLKEMARGVDPAILVRVGIFMASKNELLGKCDPMSVLGALLDCARVGLEPGGRAGGAYLVPYWNKNLKCYQAQMQTDYRGEIELIKRGGEVADVWARMVYANEVFEDEGGDSPRLKHIAKKLDPNRGEAIGAYAVVTFRDGRKKWHVLSREEIETQHRSRSQSFRTAQEKGWSSSPWISDEEAMWLKTAIRVACSKEPVSVVGKDYAKWTSIEASRDRGEEPEVAVDDTEEVEAPKSAVAQLEDELAAEGEADRAMEREPTDEELPPLVDR